VNSKEIIEHFNVVKGNFNEIRDDGGTEILVQTLTKEWIVAGHTKEVIKIFNKVGIKEELFEKLGYDFANNKPMQHVYLDIVNKRLKEIKDINKIKRKELNKIFTRVNISQEINKDGLSDLAKFIVELNLTELENIKNYFSSAVNYDFNGVHQIISYAIGTNENLIVNRLMEFLNRSPLEETVSM